ncbi:MAG: hypothetical protein LBH20_04710 [Treponema sp.]|jgi:HEAT repeat protein|nr:hypothetical protein [Treponema sp.]
MKKIFCAVLFLTGVALYAQDESGSAVTPSASAGQSDNSPEKVRYNTIKYGTETEIVTLIQTLKTEGSDYLDNEITALVEKTRNQKILAGAFSFFGEREKSGLEDRAIRALEERDEEKNETILAAIDYLGKAKAEKAAPVLRKLIESNEKRFVNAALRSFGRISGSGGRSSDAAEYLVDFYENGSPDDESRREIIAALGAAGSASAVQFLAGIASNSDERAGLRTAALESISKIGDSGGLDAVLACVTSSDPNLRSAAVTALGPFPARLLMRRYLTRFGIPITAPALRRHRPAASENLPPPYPTLNFAPNVTKFPR